MIIYQENCVYIIAVAYKSKYLIIVKIMENMDCFQNTYSDKQQIFWLEETIRLKYTLRKKILCTSYWMQWKTLNRASSFTCLQDKKFVTNGALKVSLQTEYKVQNAEYKMWS